MGSGHPVGGERAAGFKPAPLLVLRQLVGPGLIFLGAVALFVVAGRLPVVPVPGQLGPDFWPRVILIGLMGGCLLKALEVSRSKTTTASPAQPLRVPKLTGGIALVLAYPALTPLLGFPLTTFLFLLAYMWLAGTRRPVPLVAISALGTVALLYLFVKVVYLPLPKGAGLLDDFTILLYRLLRIF